MPQLRENWRPSLCLLMADCQPALCSFRSAKSHNAFWHGKRKNTWWRARRQLGSWLRSCIMEWKRWTNGKRERKTWEKYHREMWGEGVVFGMSQGAATKRWTIAGGHCRGMDHRLPVGLLPVEDLFQWWWTCVSIASLASTWAQSSKASNVPAVPTVFRQTVSETLSVAPGRNSWVLPVILRLLSPAVGTCLISEKGYENDGRVFLVVFFFIQKVYIIFVTFSYCLISLQCCCSVHSLPLCPSQLRVIRIVKQFRTNYCYTQSCFPTAIFISSADICS